MLTKKTPKHSYVLETAFFEILNTIFLEDNYIFV